MSAILSEFGELIKKFHGVPKHTDNTQNVFFRAKISIRSQFVRNSSQISRSLGYHKFKYHEILQESSFYLMKPSLW